MEKHLDKVSSSPIPPAIPPGGANCVTSGDWVGGGLAGASSQTATRETTEGQPVLGVAGDPPKQTVINLLSRGDLQLLERAIRQGWPTDPVIANQIMDQISPALDTLMAEGKHRQAIRIVRLCIKIEGIELDEVLSPSQKQFAGLAMKPAPKRRQRPDKREYRQRVARELEHRKLIAQGHIPTNTFAEVKHGHA